MGGGIMSAKGELNRMDSAAALAAIGREMCEEPVIYATAGNDGTRIHKTGLVPARRGMALIDAIKRMPATLGSGGIFLTPSLRYIKEQETEADRIIVITDEQDCASADRDKPGLAQPFGTAGNYLLNVGAYKNGIGYGDKWVHMDGFSPQMFTYIKAAEGLISDNILQDQDEDEQA